MGRDDFAKLQEKLSVLHRQLAVTTQPPLLPFSCQHAEYRSLLAFLDRMIVDSNAKIRSYSDDCEVKAGEIRSLESETGSAHAPLSEECNLVVRLQMLEVECQRVRARFVSMQQDAACIEDRIRCLQDEMGVAQEVCVGSGTLAVQCEKLRDKLLVLERQRAEAEMNKMRKVQEIIEVMRLLKDRDFDETDAMILEGKDVRLCDVERRHRVLTHELASRKIRIEGLTREIARASKFLSSVVGNEDENRKNGRMPEDAQDMHECVYPPHSDDTYTIKRISDMEAWVEKLHEKKKRMFKRIFVCKLGELSTMCAIFGIQMEEYDETEECLEKIEKMVEEMLPKKEMFVEIQGLIDQRDNILSAMIDFEKIASDPRRLFKSSFQLLSEEKFRKNAAPSLFRMERELLEKIGEYENQFGPFCRNGSYRDQLVEEIRNRIINKNVFIVGGLDSPRKRRK